MLIVNEADAFIGSSAQAIATALNHPDVETIKTAYIQVNEADGEVVIDMDETSEVTTGSPADYGFIADAGSSLTIDNANINFGHWYCYHYRWNFRIRPLNLGSRWL